MSQRETQAGTPSYPGLLAVKDKPITMQAQDEVSLRAQVTKFIDLYTMKPQRKTLTLMGIPNMPLGTWINRDSHPQCIFWLLIWVRYVLFKTGI